MTRDPNLHLYPVAMAWVLAFCLLVLGTAATLRAFAVPLIIILGWALVSCSVFAAFEPGLVAVLSQITLPTKRKTPPEEARNVPESPTSLFAVSGPADEPPTSWRRTGRRSLESLFTIALAALALHAARIIQPVQQRDSQLVVEELRASLKQCLDHSCTTGNAANSGGGTLRLDPQLEQAVTEYLKRADSRPASSSSPAWRWTTALVILALIAGAVTIVLIARKKPATAAPLGAAGLAVAAVENAEHLSRLDPVSWSFWTVVFLFGAVTAVLIFACFRYYRSDKYCAKKEPISSGDSPLNTLLSVAVLLWAVLMVCYRAEPKQNSGPGKQPQAVTYKLLTPISGFASYSAEIPTHDGPASSPIEALARESSSMAAGDVLLLLGSADCARIRKAGATTNKDLATRRASAVASALSPRNLPGTIKAESLYQPESCTGSSNMRAVFPVLLQPARQ